MNTGVLLEWRIGAVPVRQKEPGPETALRLKSDLDPHRTIPLVFKGVVSCVLEKTVDHLTENAVEFLHALPLFDDGNEVCVSFTRVPKCVVGQLEDNH